MFVSSDYLGIHYGIDDKIARFFADREPPANNLYWHNRLLYLRPAAGYIFIPLIVDLLHKIGIDKQQLLSEDFVGTMESVGHISALEETNQITRKEAIERCAELVREQCKCKEWFDDLMDYFSNGTNNPLSKLATPFKALHRGDVFLFSICALNFDLSIKDQIIEHWFALISMLLLIDDAEDLQADITAGEENAFLQRVPGTDLMTEIKVLVERSTEVISRLNRLMANQLERQFREVLEQPHIIQQINQL